MIHKVVNGRITEVWRSSFRGPQSFRGGQANSWQTTWDVPEAQTVPDEEGWQQKAFAKGYATGWLHQYKAKGGKGTQPTADQCDNARRVMDDTAQTSGGMRETPLTSGASGSQGEEKRKGNGGQPTAETGNGLATAMLTEAVANLSAAMAAANGHAPALPTVEEGNEAANAA